MRPLILSLIFSCQLLTVPKSASGQSDSISVKFDVQAFSLQGDLTHESSDKQECEVRAVVLVGTAASEAGTRNIISKILSTTSSDALNVPLIPNLNWAALSDSQNNRNVEGLYLDTKQSKASFFVKLEADPNENVMIVLVFNRKGNRSRFTAVVPYIPVKRQVVNGQKVFVPDQKHALDVTVPKYEPAPCPPVVCDPCRAAVTVRRVPGSCARIPRRR